jgi:aminomethyltransferase
MEIKSRGSDRKLCGFISEEKVFPRPGYDIRSNGKTVGKLTSGTVSPVLNKPIALGYIEKEYAAEGNEISVDVRGKEVPAVVVKLPFIKK